LSRVPVDAFECIIFCPGYNLKVGEHFYINTHSQIHKVLEKQFPVPIR